MVPAALLRVAARLQLARRVRARAAAAVQAVAVSEEAVKRLLDRRVLQEEAARVAVVGAAVGITTLVQRLAEHGATDAHATADQQARQFAELHVSEPVAPERERASVAERDAAGAGWRGVGQAGRGLATHLDRRLARRPARSRVVVLERRQAGRLRRAHHADRRPDGRPDARHAARQVGQAEVLGFGTQAGALREVVGQCEPLRTAKVVEHVAEERPVAVDEVVSATVLRHAAVSAAREHDCEQRVALAGQRAPRRAVHTAADVELDDLWEGVV